MGNCLSPSASTTEQFASLLVEKGLILYTVAKLKKATKNFGDEMKVAGSCGGVVRGYINPKTLSPAKEGVGIAIAVKSFYLPSKEALQEWLLKVVRHNSHPCWVKPIGYGSEDNELFIVTEYFPNGSLEHHICRENHPNSLSWETRLKISIGAAQGLAFLHSRINTGLYRGNLSPSKIMLDREFNARVSYFGLKNLFSIDRGSHVTLKEKTQATSLYLPPEYMFSGKTNMAGDVYSFGVILLAILTGFGTWQLIRAVRAIHYNGDNITEMIDPGLEGSFPIEAGRRMYQVIKLFLEEDLKKRPYMQEVLDNLNLIAQI